MCVYIYIYIYNENESQNMKKIKKQSKTKVMNLLWRKVKVLFKSWCRIIKTKTLTFFHNKFITFGLLFFSISSIYIYIYSHPQTDYFVVSQLFSMARHVGHLKLGSKPAQLYVRLSIRPLGQQAYHVGLRIIRYYVATAAFICLHFSRIHCFMHKNAASYHNISTIKW